jgi:flagellum-specific ATP synthase
VERAGNAGAQAGSITAFYTVLTEGDDPQDPIADAARAILDGHIVLSRRLAEAGHYPAIDVESSISRVMHDIVPQLQLRQARQLKRLLSIHEHNRDLVAIGAYRPGTDPRIDAALAAQPHIAEFLRQDLHERVGFGDSVAQLDALIGETE